MITLKKRVLLEKRCFDVFVFDLLNDPDFEEGKKYIVNKFGYTKYRQIRDKANELEAYWLVISKKTDFWDLYFEFEDILKEYKTFSMFTKNDRSSFKYWFAHWCGFQLTALNLGIWKFKYLFHDIEKPWLKLLWKGDYKRVQKWHRTHNNHHLEYGLLHGWDNIDWYALMIDWECCGFSKQEAQLDARETMEYEVQRDKWKPYEKEIRNHLEPILECYFM